MDRIGLYPVVIYEDRYGGTYSGGNWLAVAQGDKEERNLFLSDAYGGDPDAAGWGRSLPAWVGVGETPNDALEDLAKKLPVEDWELSGQRAADSLAAAMRDYSEAQALEVVDSGRPEVSEKTEEND